MTRHTLRRSWKRLFVQPRGSAPRRLRCEWLEPRQMLHAGVLSGFVYIDADGNGARDAGEQGVPGVLISLTGTEDGGAAVDRTTLSQSDGSYSFENLSPGTYAITESQPKPLFDGEDSSDAAGANVDNDQITMIALGDDETIAENNFGEGGLRPEFVGLRFLLASKPTPSAMLRETIASSEEVVGNLELAALIRAGASQPPTGGDPNSAPVAVADAYTVDVGVTLTVPNASGVLVNDTDADADALSAQLVANVTNGTLSLAADGSFTYTPNSGFSGQDTFTYLASDGTFPSNIVSVAIAVADQNTFTVSESAAADAVVGQVTPLNSFGPGVRFEIEQAGLPNQLLLGADDHLSGNPSAPVVLIEYMDLSCPHCRDIHPVVQDLLDDFDGELLVVRRHLLLVNSSTSEIAFPHSLEAARATEAAARQGKFDEMVDKLFDNQDTWRAASDASVYFDQYAQEIGLDLTQFASDQADPSIDGGIDRDRASAAALGLSSTPSFFINGALTSNPVTLTAFTPLIAGALADANAPIAIDRDTGQLFVNNPGALSASTAPTIQFNAIITDASGARQTVPVTINVQAAGGA